MFIKVVGAVGLAARNNRLDIGADLDQSYQWVNGSTNLDRTQCDPSTHHKSIKFREQYQ